MPRSKKAVHEQRIEDEKAQPENVASRALAHKAKIDIEVFLTDLQVSFAELATETLRDFLPQIKIKRRESLY